MISNIITIEPTLTENIEKIIEIEKCNSYFVGQYDFDKHQMIKQPLDN